MLQLIHALYCMFILQTVVVFVRMEGHVKAHITALTVTVAEGTQDPTARTEVGTGTNSVCSQFIH